MALHPQQRLTPEEARRDHRAMLRFMALNALVGCLIGVATAVILILMNVGGLGTRIAHAGDPVVPVLLVVAPFAFIFGGAAAASAVLLMPYKRKYKDEGTKDV